MIYTVTLNPAIDKTVTIPNFSVGKVNRISTMRIDAGGKGINVSKCLMNLGADTIAAMLLGGSSGKKIADMLKEQGVQTLKVDVPGETRTNLKVIDPELHTNTDINEPGPLVTEDILEELKQKIGEVLFAGDIVILSGSLPKGVSTRTYRDWCEYFGERSALVYLDADGEAMREGIKAGPYMVKPNDEELSRLVGRELSSEEELVRAGKQLIESGIEEVVISLGSKGALFLNSEGCYRADALKVPVQSTVGAGDSMVAAMAYAKEKGLSRIEQIRTAVAMGAASVMCDGTQAPRAEDVFELSEKVKVWEVKI